jgi:hypothetical protein
MTPALTAIGYFIAMVVLSIIVVLLPIILAGLIDI